MKNVITTIMDIIKYLWWAILFVVSSVTCFICIWMWLIQGTLSGDAMLCVWAGWFICFGISAIGYAVNVDNEEPETTEKTEYVVTIRKI